MSSDTFTSPTFRLRGNKILRKFSSILGGRLCKKSDLCFTLLPETETHAMLRQKVKLCGRCRAEPHLCLVHCMLYTPWPMGWQHRESCIQANASAGWCLTHQHNPCLVSSVTGPHVQCPETHVHTEKTSRWHCHLSNTPGLAILIHKAELLTLTEGSCPHFVYKHMHAKLPEHDSMGKSAFCVINEQAYLQKVRDSTGI